MASAAFAFPLRLGSGGFVAGYRTALPKDDGDYAVLKMRGAAGSADDPRGQPWDITSMKEDD